MEEAARRDTVHHFLPVSKIFGRSGVSRETRRSQWY